MSALELYAPLPAVFCFLAGFTVAILGGLLVARVR